MRKIFYVICFIIITSTFSAIFPYPVFSNHTNITEKVAYEINNYNEVEISNSASSTIKVMSLDFSIVDSLIAVGDEVEIYDLNTESSFTVIRIGGVHHLDIQPVDKQNANILYEICDKNWSWQRRPVLIKLNDNAFIPASISCYPHGYSNGNSINGHICLHVYGSKTDGTREEDAEHQRCVKFAEKHGKEFIKKIDY